MAVPLLQPKPPLLAQHALRNQSDSLWRLLLRTSLLDLLMLWLPSYVRSKNKRLYCSGFENVRKKRVWTLRWLLWQKRLWPTCNR